MKMTLMVLLSLELTQVKYGYLILKYTIWRYGKPIAIVYYYIRVIHFKGTSQLSITPQFYTGSNVLIYPDGEVLFIPQISLKVHCANFSHSNWPQVTNNLIINIVLSSFEKGEQVCNIKLGSWTHDGLILNLTLYNNKVPIGNKLGLSKARI